METSNPGSSSADSTGVTDVTSDYGVETHNLLRNIVQGLHDEINDQNKALQHKSYLERAARLTGFHPETLKNISESNVLFYLCQEIDRKKIHEKIVSYCFVSKRYPTSGYLYFMLREHLPPYIDKQSFLKLLIKMGYIFKKQAHSYVPVIAERTEITFERYLYLKNITSYRGSRNIFFVGEASASLEGRVFNLNQTEAYGKKKTLVPFMFIISAITGLIHLHIVDKFSASDFQYWIINEVIPKLPLNSVVVIDNSIHHNAQRCQPPEINSLKAEIIEWLEYHDVPYSINMSKMQLWELAEKCTDLEVNVYVIDNVLKESGHEVLRLPDCINDLSLATGVRHLIKSVLHKEMKGVEDIKACLNDVLRNNVVNELRTYNANLINEEKHLLSLDQQFDAVRDIMESLKYQSRSSEEVIPKDDTVLPYLSDSE